MKEEPTASGLGPDKLHRLLQICSQSDPAEEQIDADHRKAELLQDYLAEALPVEVPTSHMSEQLTTLCQISGIASEESIGNMLRHSKTDVNLLRRIRDRFKQRTKNADLETEQAATTIYYAAIAYALVMQNSKITKFSYKDLLDAFFRLADTKWIPPALSGLFEKACEYCRSKLEA